MREVALERVDALEHRELGGEPGSVDLVHRHAAAQAAKPVLAQWPQRHAFAQEHLGRVRDEYLTAVRERHQPGGAVHLGAEVVPVALGCFTGVQRHPNRELDDEVVAQLLLGLDRGRGRVGGGREGRAEAVATDPEHVPAVPFDRASHDLVVDSHRVGHVGRGVVPELRRALDVGEQKGHRAHRELARHGGTVTQSENPDRRRTWGGLYAVRERRPRTRHDQVVTETRAARLKSRPRTPADAEALARFDRRMTLPLIVAAVLPLFLLPGGAYPLLSALVFVMSWIVFLVDFIVQERRLDHYVQSWLGRFDLMVVILTAPWFLIVGPSDSKFVLLIRLARVARLAMATKGARRLFERLGRVAFVAAAVVVVGAALAYRAEHATNPGFATFGDALWWAIVTLTTVGYGDIVPKTTAGRVDGVLIMITGVAVLGVLAGSLASFFHVEPSSLATAPPDAPEATDATDPTEPRDALATEVVELRTQVALARRRSRPTRPTRPQRIGESALTPAA